MYRFMMMVIVASMLGGCAASERVAVEADVAPVASAAGTETLKESLFKDDQKVISNDDMAKILDAKVVLPAHGKIAVIRFGQLPYWWGWSEDFVRMNQKIDADFL